MNYVTLDNNDFLRFYCALADAGKADDFADGMYSQMLKLARKELSAKQLKDSGFRYLTGDDFCVFGVESEDSCILWFDDYFIDEESLEYNDDASPVAFDVFRNGLSVLSPEIVIGQALDAATVKDVLDGNFSGNICDIKLGEGRRLIDCYLKDFELIFSIADGVLNSVSIMAIGM